MLIPWLPLTCYASLERSQFDNIIPNSWLRHRITHMLEERQCAKLNKWMWAPLCDLSFAILHWENPDPIYMMSSHEITKANWEPENKLVKEWHCLLRMIVPILFNSTSKHTSEIARLLAHPWFTSAFWEIVKSFWGGGVSNAPHSSVKRLRLRRVEWLDQVQADTTRPRPQPMPNTALCSISVILEEPWTCFIIMGIFHKSFIFTAPPNYQKLSKIMYFHER